MYDFRVLGDLSVTIDDAPRPITAAKQRAALAILLLSPNRTVSSVSLLDGIWGSELPQHPDTALQIVVSRLRGSLGPGASRLVSGPSGYRIEVAADELDLSLVQTAFSDGQRLRRDNDPNRAADVLGEALTRWTAEPLYDLIAFPFCTAARSRLRELRIAIYELRNDVLLEAGRHVELLETIDEWIAEEPWRERLRAQHVLALYRSGRQVEALRAFDAYRTRLIEELGVEPSDELRELHRDVLSHAPRLAVGIGPVASRIPLWTSLVLPFVGRSVEEEQIFARVREVFSGARKMILVDGEPGIGKTRLILEVARRVQDDAIILSATANDSVRPAVVGLADAVVEAALQLPDDELRGCLGRWPADLARVVPALRERLPDLVPSFDGDAAEQGRHLINSVASCVNALSRRAPIVLLLDDLHRSGPALLRLLGRLMVVDDEQRMLILATARTPSLDHASNLVELADHLEQRGYLERLPLSGLEAESVERLLWRLGTRVPTAKAQLLHQVTGGQPFFLSELLQTDDWQRALIDPPASVREFIRRRVHELGDPEEAVLVDAAGLYIAFDAALLSEITGVPVATTASLIDRAMAAGILRTVGKGTFTFVHELCRRALIETVDDAGRASLNHRIAVSLEARGMPPSVLAMHWRLVPGAEAAERTLRYALVAGDSAVLGLDPAAAVAWYEIAQAEAGDPMICRDPLNDLEAELAQTESRTRSTSLEV